MKNEKLKGSFGLLHDGVWLPILSSSLIGAFRSVRERGSSNMLPYSEIQLPVLVIAPHPDDEWLSSAGLLSEISHFGDNVDVVIFSDGEKYGSLMRNHSGKQNKQLLAEARYQESVSALRYLTGYNIHPIRMSVPDGSISSILRDETILNKVCNFLLSKMLDKKYGTIIFPHFFDDHPDHWSTSIITLLTIDMFLNSCPNKPNVLPLMYLTHFGNYPLRGSSNHLSLCPPFMESDPNWMSYLLDSDAYRLKRTALKLYRSQIFSPSYAIYLSAFVKKNELFYNLDLTKKLDFTLPEKNFVKSREFIKFYQSGNFVKYEKIITDSPNFLPCDENCKRVVLKTDPYGKTKVAAVFWEFNER